MPGAASSRQALAQRIADTVYKRGSIDQNVFAAEGKVKPNTTGEESLICQLRVDASLMIRHGRQNRFPVTIPAFEQFTTDGSAGDAETFNLAHGLIESPNARSIVVWNGSNLVPMSEITPDYANDSFQYTDAGTNNTLHVWYVTDAAGTLVVEKSAPSNGSNTEPLYEANTALVNPTKQVDQPEYFGPWRGDGDGEEDGGSDIDLTPYLGKNMTLDVRLNAPFKVRFSDPDGDGAAPTNMLLDIPVNRGKRSVPGLTAAVADEMR